MASLRAELSGRLFFSLRLWRPSLQRRHAYRKQQHAGISHFSSIDAATLSCSLVNARSVGKKSASLSQMIVDARLDMLLITETWPENTESVSLKRVMPNGYKCIDTARPLASEHVHKAELRNYGGIALVYRDNVTVMKCSEPATFEHLCVDVTTEHDSLLLLCVYRPGSQAVTAEFFLTN